MPASPSISLSCARAHDLHKHAVLRSTAGSFQIGQGCCPRLQGVSSVSVTEIGVSATPWASAQVSGMAPIPPCRPQGCGSRPWLGPAGALWICLPPLSCAVGSVAIGDRAALPTVTAAPSRFVLKSREASARPWASMASGCSAPGRPAVPTHCRSHSPALCCLTRRFLNPSQGFLSHCPPALPRSRRAGVGAFLSGNCPGC